MARLGWALALLALSGCAPRSIGPLGGSFSAAPWLTVSELRDQDATADGRRVRTGGRITRVCQHMGCWLYVTDEQSELYVDLEMGKLFTIPSDSQSRDADIEGIVRFAADKPYLVGKVIQIR